MSIGLPLPGSNVVTESNPVRAVRGTPVGGGGDGHVSSVPMSCRGASATSTFSMSMGLATRLGERGIGESGNPNLQHYPLFINIVFLSHFPI